MKIQALLDQKAGVTLTLMFEESLKTPLTSFSNHLCA